MTALQDAYASILVVGLDDRKIIRLLQRQVLQAVRAAKRAMQSGQRMYQEGVRATDIYAVHKQTHQWNFDMGKQGGVTAAELEQELELLEAQQEPEPKPEPEVVVKPPEPKAAPVRRPAIKRTHIKDAAGAATTLVTPDALVQGVTEGVPTESLAAVKDAMLDKLHGRPPAPDKGSKAMGKPAVASLSRSAPQPNASATGKGKGGPALPDSGQNKPPLVPLLRLGEAHAAAGSPSNSNRQFLQQMDVTVPIAPNLRTEKRATIDRSRTNTPRTFEHKPDYVLAAEPQLMPFRLFDPWDDLKQEAHSLAAEAQSWSPRERSPRVRIEEPASTHPASWSSSSASTPQEGHTRTHSPRPPTSARPKSPLGSARRRMEALPEAEPPVAQEAAPAWMVQPPWAGEGPASARGRAADIPRLPLLGASPASTTRSRQQGITPQQPLGTPRVLPMQPDQTFVQQHIQGTALPTPRDQARSGWSTPTHRPLRTRSHEPQPRRTRSLSPRSIMVQGRSSSSRQPSFRGHSSQRQSTGAPPLQPSTADPASGMLLWPTSLESMEANTRFAVTSARTWTSSTEEPVQHDREARQAHVAAHAEQHLEAQLAAMATLGISASTTRPQTSSLSRPGSPLRSLSPAHQHSPSRARSPELSLGGRPVGSPGSPGRSPRKCTACSPTRTCTLQTGPHLPRNFAYRLMQIKSVSWDSYRL